MGVFESSDRTPVQYLKTGDKALLIAWASLLFEGKDVLAAVLCLEDGSSVLAEIGEFKFEYRYSNTEQKWFDVSRIPADVEDPEEPDADADQEDADDGGPAVP